mgnify:CR=1 FL=1
MNSKKNEKKKEYISKFESELDKYVKKEKEKMLRSLISLYYRLKEKGTVGTKVGSILLHLRLRIEGFTREDESVRSLEHFLLEIIDALEGVASLREIMVEMNKKGWKIRTNDLLTIIYNLARRGIFSVMGGVVVKGNITETRLTNKIIKELHTSPITIEQLAQKLQRDVNVIHAIVNSLKRMGIITMGENGKILLVR